MSIKKIASFVDYVLVKGEIIWYLSLTAWLISLSIILSSSKQNITRDIVVKNNLTIVREEWGRDSGERGL